MRELREAPGGFVVVTDDRKPIGVLDEAQVASAIQQGASDLDPVRQWVKPLPPLALNTELISLAWERFRQGETFLVITDSDQVYLGIVTPSRLAVPDALGYRPRQIGGMATPFGVYLTDGVVGAGVPGYALFSTGFLLGLILLCATLFTKAIELRLPDDLVNPWVDASLQGLTLVIFLVGIRLLPISGIHAAEHMVVHAVERGEELEVESVRRMPRVHPRCGTNIAAAASLFLGVFLLPLPGGDELRLMLALLATLFFWRPLGILMQYYVTTSPPTKRQVELGIQSAKALLAKSAVNRRTSGSLLSRLWVSGLFHVLAGKLLVGILIMGLFIALDGWRALRVLF